MGKESWLLLGVVGILIVSVFFWGKEVGTDLGSEVGKKAGSEPVRE